MVRLLSLLANVVSIRGGNNYLNECGVCAHLIFTNTALERKEFRVKINIGNEWIRFH